MSDLSTATLGRSVVLLPVIIVAVLAAPLSGQQSSLPNARSAVSTPDGAGYNLRVISDASPDLTDLKGFVDSTTSRWTLADEKVWALFCDPHSKWTDTTILAK